MADAMCAGIGRGDCSPAETRGTNWVFRHILPGTAALQAVTNPTTPQAMSQASSDGDLVEFKLAAEPEDRHTTLCLPLPVTTDPAAEKGTPTVGSTTYPPHAHPVVQRPRRGSNTATQQPATSRSAQTPILTDTHLQMPRRGTLGRMGKQPKRHQRRAQRHIQRGTA
ncbi:Hypothetical predicted protein [Pelobates cultripes]|uniref:Uncharacterized protein n=1 Tax=Pelobates cultripes TaxID=61616 RepID=A0AAD1S260_PELCU|nr:Hypothetical predicted protein [Pelobates cultripes]